MYGLLYVAAKGGDQGPCFIPFVESNDRHKQRGAALGKVDKVTIFPTLDAFNLCIIALGMF